MQTANFENHAPQFELVCSYALYPTIGLSVLNIGGIIGVYFFGVISDK